jgi:pectate lyase
MYFKNANGNLFGTSSAILVENNVFIPATGMITSSGLTFVFDYSNNNQGGRLPNTDADVVVMAVGLNSRLIKIEYTITVDADQYLSVNAELEKTS